MRTRLLCLLLVARATLALVECSACNCKNLNQAPIIGIVAQEPSPNIAKLYPNYTSYIAAKYVKAVEASGARVVPIFMKQGPEYYKNLVQSLNGIVFPGGRSLFTEENGYAKTAGEVYAKVVEVNTGGNTLPILGVCLGFELLMHHGNGGREMRAECDVENVPLPLKFKAGYNETSLFHFAPEHIINSLSTLPITANHHKYCITEANMTRFSLNSDWQVLTTNTVPNGEMEFVSTVESLHYPFVGVQFHPEDNAYEWEEGSNDPHFWEAVYTARYFYDWLANKSRLNNNTFPTKEQEMAALIYNYPVTYTTGKFGFTETYFFR